MFNETDTPEKEEAAPTTETALPNKRPKSSNTSRKYQCQLLAERLRRGALTTPQARRELDIMGVAQRVMDLRDAGYIIITYGCWDYSECGVLHYVAKYVLLAEPKPKEPDCWQHVSAPLANVLAEFPEYACAKERDRDLRNWKKALKKTNLVFAKGFIIGRLRECGAIDDKGAEWLIQALELAGV